MFRRTLIVFAALLSLALTVGPARAATTTFSVSPLGDYVSPAAGNIHGAAVCEGGTGTISFTTLAGTPYTVSGETEVVCDGVGHAWAATIVGGPWSQGQAIVFRATLVAPSGTVFQVPKVVLR